MLALIITITIFMSISALCSLLESCLLSLSLTDIAKISEKKPLIAKIWQNFKEQIEKPISVILIVNTLAHTIGASLAGALVDSLFGVKWVALLSFIYSFAMIQWTEILPKTLGVQYKNKLAVVVAVPLNILVNLFKPILFVIHLLNKPFERKKNDNQFDTLDEINILTRFAALNKKINPDQEKILSRTLKLSRTTVKDIMVKKEEIKFLSTRLSMMDALIQAHIHHHTRYPLIDGNDIDQIIGYVNFKDIVAALQINPAEPSLKGISRPIMSVIEDEKLSNLLTRLTKGYQHIALVKNHENQIVGLITLEDMIEEIVGDLIDEYDVLPSYLYKIAINRYLIGGGCKLNELNRHINLNLPEIDQNINDYLINKIGKYPKSDEKIKDGNITFIIRKVSRSQIHELIIEKGDGSGTVPLVPD